MPNTSRINNFERKHVCLDEGGECNDVMEQIGHHRNLEKAIFTMKLSGTPGGKVETLPTNRDVGKHP